MRQAPGGSAEAKRQPRKAWAKTFTAFCLAEAEMGRRPKSTQHLSAAVSRGPPTALPCNLAPCIQPVSRQCSTSRLVWPAISHAFPLQARPALGNTQEGLQCCGLACASLIDQAGFRKHPERAPMLQCTMCFPHKPGWVWETSGKGSNAMVSCTLPYLPAHISLPIASITPLPAHPSPLTL